MKNKIEILKSRDDLLKSQSFLIQGLFICFNLIFYLTYIFIYDIYYIDCYESCINSRVNRCDK